jgi:predicted enzyme related to lactoylglutathione lyase
VSAGALTIAWRDVRKSGRVARQVVTETFFSIEVNDMHRATAFYVDALGAAVMYSAPSWTSLRIAGVRIGLFLNPEHTTSRVGLHFAVSDLAAACADVERAGGRIVAPSIEVASGVVIAQVEDTEGNTFTLRRA